VGVEPPLPLRGRPDTRALSLLPIYGQTRVPYLLVFEYVFGQNVAPSTILRHRPPVTRSSERSSDPRRLLIRERVRGQNGHRAQRAALSPAPVTRT
jgi:hypothetical protein